MWDNRKLRAYDDKLIEFQEQGLWWYVVDKSVEVDFPEVASLFERGLNTEHHIAVEETFDQMFAQIRAKAIDSARNGPTVYEAVAREIGKTQPPCIADLPAQIAFMKKCGGGGRNGLTLAEETNEYMQLRMPHGRHVSGGLF